MHVYELIIVKGPCRSVAVCINLFRPFLFVLALMPSSHIHGSSRRFHYGSNLMDDPGNANFRSLIRMHNVLAAGFEVSAKDSIGKKPFGDMRDTVCYGLIPNTAVTYKNYTV